MQRPDVTGLTGASGGSQFRADKGGNPDCRFGADRTETAGASGVLIGTIILGGGNGNGNPGTITAQQGDVSAKIEVTDVPR